MILGAGDNADMNVMRSVRMANDQIRVIGYDICDLVAAYCVYAI